MTFGGGYYIIRMLLILHVFGFIHFESVLTKMENIIKLGMLYDFYGELLTPHQKEVYEDLVYNDLSISEIAESYGISRQAAHDLIKRCNHTLSEYEEKLRLVERFRNIKNRIEAIDKLSEEEKEEILKEL